MHRGVRYTCGPRQHGGGAARNVEYHETLGYPLSIFTDMEEEGVDDDQLLEVHSLTPLN